MKISRRIDVCLPAIPVIWLATIVHASPQERAQLFKGEVRKQFMADGWAAARVRVAARVEEPMSGVDALIVHTLTAEANGTRPILRWTFTFKVKPRAKLSPSPTNA